MFCVCAFLGVSYSSQLGAIRASFFVNSSELCFELQSTNDGGMDATKQFDAFFSCDNHNGTIASGKVTSLLFPILIVHMLGGLGLNFPYIQSFSTSYEWYCKQK